MGHNPRGSNLECITRGSSPSTREGRPAAHGRGTDTRAVGFDARVRSS